jgi:hypothetical protein
MIEYESIDDSSVKVTRASLHSGKWNSIIIPMNFDEFQMRLSMWADDKEYIQDAFPSLNPDQREFIQTGITIEEWDEIFVDEEAEIKSCKS